MTATIVTTDEELKQIVQLSHKNLRANISEKEQTNQGFITWNYSFDLLQKMNAQHPHVIVKDNDKVIGYALVASRDASRFHTDLKAMIHQLETIKYNNKQLSEYSYYVMGQICVDDTYRGKGVFRMLYMHHKKLFEKDYDFVITEISTSNIRSLRAHEKIGFKIIYTYEDAVDEWDVVLWNWKI
jgi:ribosomal protein S18 acetylase RimI-like enzyme